MQHIALVRAPTNAQVLKAESQHSLTGIDSARRTFGVQLAENIKLPRDTLDDGLISRFEDTVLV